MNSNHTANIVRIDGFGRLYRWNVLSARIATVGGESFWNLTVQPVAPVDSEGNDLPPVVLSRGRVVAPVSPCGPVETLNLPL